MMELHIQTHTGAAPSLQVAQQSADVVASTTGLYLADSFPGKRCGAANPRKYVPVRERVPYTGTGLMHGRRKAKRALKMCPTLVKPVHRLFDTCMWEDENGPV